MILVSDIIFVEIVMGIVDALYSKKRVERRYEDL